MFKSQEPISTKAARHRAVSIAGRFLVYIPDAERVGVDQDRRSHAKRLRAPVERRCREFGSVIVRTVGEDAETLERGPTLIGQWKRIEGKTHFVAHLADSP